LHPLESAAFSRRTQKAVIRRRRPNGSNRSIEDNGRDALPHPS
jgi:hypothetical protein